MDANYSGSRVESKLKDVLGIFGFILAVVIGAWLINQLIFQTYRVQGPSMEPTMYTNDRLVVNRLPMTWAKVSNKTYTPKRDQIIVFKNPYYTNGSQDEFIVKRVIGLPGERVVVQNQKVTVFNSQNPAGFDPYQGSKAPVATVSGEIEIQVPSGEIFVIGDNRAENDSLDSRNGLSTIPLYDVMGPVFARTYPFGSMKIF